MSRTTEDARRSLSHYLSLGFPDYEHYLGRYDLTIGRPAIVIRRIGATLKSGPWHTLDIVQPFSIHMFPLGVEDAEQSESHATQEEQKLRDIFERGVHLGPDSWIGHNDRIPLWDWDSVALDQELPADHEPEGMMRVLDSNTQPFQDEDEPMFWRITATLRVSWRRHGRKADPEAMIPLVTMPPRLEGRGIK